MNFNPLALIDQSSSLQASRLLPPPTRIVLSVPTTLSFEGISGYLGCPSSHFNAALLENVDLRSFYEITPDTSRTSPFIGRKEMSEGL